MAERKKGVFRLLILALCAALIMCGCSKEEPKETESAEAEQQDEGVDALYGDESLGIDAGVDKELRDFRTIALFGIDNGERSDIVIIISFNKETGEARLASVVRDTYMRVKEADGDTPPVFTRCNTGYESGGKYEAMKVLNTNLDLNIRECICVDWDCAADLIEALGGLHVTIDEDMLEGINKLLPADNKIAQAGEQTINGWQAVQYLRVRKYHGGNTITRAENNQEVFIQLYNQAKSMSAEEIADIYDQIADELDTNMSRNTLTDLLAQIATVDIQQTDTYPYEWKSMKNSKNFDFRVPESVVSNVKTLHANLYGQTEYLPSMTVQTIHDEMLKAEEDLIDG